MTARSQPAAARIFSALALWHLLSLDAPTVAALWTCFVGRCIGVHLAWSAIAAMFVAVWMIYAADRLLDAKVLDFIGTDASTHFLEERHHFHHRHRTRYLTTLGLATLLLIYLLPKLSADALLRYCLLATLLGAWMLIIHARNPSGSNSHRLPKEFVVGIFFPAAVFIPSVARAPSLQLSLLPAAILLACVCTLNCLYVYAWEHPSHETSRDRAHWTTLYAVRHLPRLTMATLGVAVVVASTSSTLRQLSLACALSCPLLLALHRLRHQISAIHLRASADLALLTPCLFLPWLPR